MEQESFFPRTRNHASTYSIDNALFLRLTLWLLTMNLQMDIEMVRKFCKRTVLISSSERNCDSDLFRQNKPFCYQEILSSS